MKTLKIAFLSLICSIIFPVLLNNKLYGNLKVRQQRIQRPRPKNSVRKIIKPKRIKQQSQNQQESTNPPKTETKKSKDIKTEKTKTQTPSSLTLKGYIQQNKEMEEMPTFKIFFGGKQTTNDSEGFYSIPTEQSHFEKYYILICGKINQNFSGINTIENLSINPQKNYRFFSCKKSFDKKKNEYWILKEKELTKKQFKIPSNCIIFLINPKYIQKVEVWNIRLLNGFIPVPKIILNEETSKRKFKKKSAKSLLYSLDNRFFHEDIKREIKKFEDKPKLKVSLDQ